VRSATPPPLAAFTRSCSVLNYLAAVPPTPEIAAALPVSGPLGIAGSIAMIAITGATLWLLLDEREPRSHRADDAIAQPIVT